MKIFEFFDETQVSTGFYDPAEDKLNQRHLDDTRKTKLTLADLNRLKRMRALRKFEALKTEDLYGVMYAQPDEAAMGGPGGMF